jgi:hypothetical protein
MINLFILQLTPQLFATSKIFKNFYKIMAESSESLQILKTPNDIINSKNAKNLEVKK